MNEPVDPYVNYEEMARGEPMRIAFDARHEGPVFRFLIAHVIVIIRKHKANGNHHLARAWQGWVLEACEALP